MITLELTKEEAAQLIECIESGLAIYKNQKSMIKILGPKLMGSKDKRFLRVFRVRVANRIKATIENKMKFNDQ